MADISSADYKVNYNELLKAKGKSEICSYCKSHYHGMEIKDGTVYLCVKNTNGESFVLDEIKIGCNHKGCCRHR